MSETEKPTENRKMIVIPSRIINYRIQKLFEQNRNQWETVQGIAQSTNLSPELVERHILKHPSLYKKSPITVGGIPLFALKTSAESPESSMREASTISVLKGPIVVQQKGSREPFRGKVIITNIPKKHILDG